MKFVVLVLGLVFSLGCASRNYHPPQFRSIELRGATITDERDQRRTESCNIASWIYDAGEKRWIGICRQ